MKLKELLKVIHIDVQAIELRVGTRTLDPTVVFASREDGTDIPEDLQEREVIGVWAKDYELCDGNEPPLEIDLEGEYDGGGIFTESRKVTLTLGQLRQLVRQSK